VRKNRPSSSIVLRPGDVEDGEIITMPLGSAAFCKIAPLTPEQAAPTMPLIPSAIRRSALDTASALSTQPVSAREGVTVAPSISMPLSVTSCMASSALDAMMPVSDSIGPV